MWERMGSMGERPCITCAFLAFVLGGWKVCWINSHDDKYVLRQAWNDDRNDLPLLADAFMNAMSQFNI